MARQLNILNPLRMKSIKEAGIYHDGGGLYLRVNPSGAKSWLFCYKLNGKSREMGLGTVDAVALAEARQKRDECRKLLANKIDPVDARKAAQAQVKLEAARKILFRDCAEDYFEAHKDGWKNKKHAQQYENTMKTYVYPVIGAISVQDVTLDLVMKIVEPIWKTKTETANRVRGRIEKVLDYASSKELRQGENPARWRGRLENLLPRPTKIQKVKHHAALPYAELGDFMAQLRRQGGIDALALRFIILTATRTNEVISARWEEFDLQKRIWTIPASRMKAGKEHRVPLTDMAVEVLKAVLCMAGHDADIWPKQGWIFPGAREGRPLSGMAMLMLLRRLKRKDITVHGFRSTFRDWAAEQTSFAREVAEQALAHSLGGVEAAYRRSDLFDKRRKLMEVWARYCSTAPQKSQNASNIFAFKKI